MTNIFGHFCGVGAVVAEPAVTAQSNAVHLIIRCGEEEMVGTCGYFSHIIESFNIIRDSNLLVDFSTPPKSGFAPGQQFPCRGKRSRDGF